MGSLADRLATRIRAHGPLTFAAFMEAALYDPADGYYTTRAAIGFEGDFLTSPDLGPAFGRALARAMGELWAALDRPPSWDLVEAGAGRGVLMRDLLAALPQERPEAARGVRPAIVDVSPRLREQQALALEGRQLRWAATARALAPIQGVVFANEVLDAFPVHVLVQTAEDLREVYVDVEDGRFVEVLRAPSAADLRFRVPSALPLGGRWEASPAAEGWVAGIAAALGRGYLLLVDYGADEAGLLARAGAGTLRGFSRHALVRDPLAEPGAHDLTASVNFTAIRRAAEGAGLRHAGTATQREVLQALGIREAASSGAFARPGPGSSMPTAPGPLEQLRAASRRSAIETLLDPAGLGAFVVTCFVKDAPADGLGFLGAGSARQALSAARTARARA